MTPIRKLFIANRAEIALRIVRTARRLGITTVVPRHDRDRHGPALQEADETVALVGEPPVSAWLDGAGLIRAALEAGCDAIHPGYGFLSENAGFARAVTDAGLIFVGPGADAIALMGDKISARHFAVKHGVPVTPSADEADDPAELCRSRAGGGLSAADQGRGRGWRQGHADRARSGAAGRRHRHRAQREPALLR
jgi:acetyl/propionyl-CoA carboxylase alpha subunit